MPVQIDQSRDALLTAFGKVTLADRYLYTGESYQDLFARVATTYADNEQHAQRLYDYMSKLWFMPATPILSNGGTDRGLPISCYLNEVDDSLTSIAELWNENLWLAARGGGIGTYWSKLRAVGERVGQVGKTSGIIPFIKMQDTQTLAISQGSLRRGSAAVYIDIDHPEIVEFIELRKPTGGDPNRKALNLHHGIAITDAFMHAVAVDGPWELHSPKTREVIEVVKARDLWIRILTTRLETGEPYLLFIDTVRKATPAHHAVHGMHPKTSNLCVEITLPTGIDQYGKRRTAVCCLSSLNLDKWFEWWKDDQFIEDIMRMLDNVLQDFIDNAPDTMEAAKYSAMRERSVGLGVMGFHSFLQANNIPFESVMAKVWNKRIFKRIREEADRASKLLAHERGPCWDAYNANIQERFSYKMALAPTASISVICGGASPGIDPITANVYLQKTLSGSFAVRNQALQQVLAAHGRDDDETWSTITTTNGSVQHLDFLTQHERDVFKTAFELDQRWVIEHAADRAGYICQSQSVNLFIPANVHKRMLHQIHYAAWKKGVKSLYYCRSMSIARADVVSVQAVSNAKDEEECLACQ